MVFTPGGSQIYGAYGSVTMKLSDMADSDIEVVVQTKTAELVTI